MPVQVPYSTIDSRVVRDFTCAMRQTAEERGHDVTIQQPFMVSDRSWFEVLGVLRETPHSEEALFLYRQMVSFLPGYELVREQQEIFQE